MSVGPDSMRQGIGEELWYNLPQSQRDKVPYPSKGDAVAPCGHVGFKKDMRGCKAAINRIMCGMCQGAA